MRTFTSVSTAPQSYAVLLLAALSCCTVGNVDTFGHTQSGEGASVSGSQSGTAAGASIGTGTGTGTSITTNANVTIGTSSGGPASGPNSEACVPAPAASVVVGPTLSYIVTTADANLLLASQPNSTFVTGSCDAPGVVALSINANITYQPIEGFGAHLTDSSARELSDWSHLDSHHQLFTELFSPVSGLGMNLVHVDVGAGEFSSNGPLTYDGKGNNVAPDPNLSQFSMGGAEDHYLFSMLGGIRQANPNVRLVAAPWSAPSWMKDTNTYATGSLAPQYMGTMAEYMLKFLQAYQAAGNTIYAIAPQNEPDTMIVGNANTAIYPSSLLPAAQETLFIKEYLGPLLRAQDPDVKIFTYEGDWSGVAHPLTVLADPAAHSYVSGVAFHCETGDASAQQEVLDAHPEQEIWITRCGRTQATSFAEDLQWYGENFVVNALANGARSLIMYNVVLDQNNGKVGYGGGGYANYGSNARPLVNIANAGSDYSGSYILARNVEYYVMGHLAKYIKTGAHRIASNVTGTAVLQVAFQNPDRSVVAFVLNTQNIPQALSVHVGAYAAPMMIPAHAISTAVWRNSE